MDFFAERRIGQGEIIPAGYRIAYEDIFRHDVVCYPIGLHLAVRAFRRVREWSYRYQPSRLEIMLKAARKQGFDDGADWGASSERAIVREEVRRFVDGVRRGDIKAIEKSPLLSEFI